MLETAVIYLAIFGVCNVFIVTTGLSVSINDLTGTSTNISSTVMDDNDMAEARSFSAVSIGIVEDYIQYKLPPEAQPEGEIILNNFKNNLIHCESFIQSVANIWKYKQCASGLIRDAMAELSGLQQKYRPYTSSATRLTLFCY